jgi:hypothetical protein
MSLVRSRPLASIFSLAAAALTVFVVSASVLAASTSYSASITISEKFPAFHGKLHSDNKFCVADRPVKVYRERPGADKLLGTRRSEGDGSWKVSIGKKLISGAYYSVAPLYGSASLGIVCRVAQSKLVVVD